MKLSRRSLLAVPFALGACAKGGQQRLLWRDDFQSGLDQWRIEAAAPGRISARGGVLDIDVPAGTTLWFLPELSGPVAIHYEVMAVSEGGANDRVSDVNAFWMASDPAVAGGSVLTRPRSGRFEEYDLLATYYVGIGGNTNSTTRFRRYIGRAGNRPLRPEHDSAKAADLLVPNRWFALALIADVSRIEVRRDGATLFRMDDPAPYRRGHFGLRTTQSHLRVRNFRITRP